MARRSSIGTLAIHLGHPTASLIGPQNYFPTHKRSEQISISDDIQASLWTGISSVCSNLEEEDAWGSRCTLPHTSYQKKSLIALPEISLINCRRTSTFSLSAQTLRTSYNMLHASCIIHYLLQLLIKIDLPAQSVRRYD